MADVKIRKLDDWVVDEFRKQASAAGISLEERLRQALRERALLGQHAAGELVRRHLRTMRKTYGPSRGSLPALREVREGEARD